MKESNNPAEPVEIIQLIEECTTTSDAIEVFEKFIARYGFNSYLIGKMVNPASQSKSDVQTNWPKEWIDRWVDQNYVFHDPIFQFALRHREPFLWKTAIEQGSKLGQKVVKEGREHGLYDGIAIPISTDIGPLGCVTIGSSDSHFDADAMPILELVCIHLYQHLQMLDDRSMAELFGILTKRETEFCTLSLKEKPIGKLAKFST